MLEKYITGITAEDAKVLDPLVTPDAYARGSIFIEQFAYPEGFYILTHGKVRLYQLTTLAKTLCALELAEISASPDPQILCETEILLEQINLFTAVAVNDIELLHFPTASLNQVKQEHPAIALKIYDALARTLAFRHVNTREKFESRIVGHATNPHSALALLKKYVGNVSVCTPQMAKKLFKIDSPVI